jgi:hypothetical protein
VERLGRAAQVPGRVFGLERPADDHPAERGKLRQETGTRNAGERTITFFFILIILVKISLDCRPNSESKARHDFGKRCLPKQFEPVL